jgi:hypothetical protein
MACKCTTITQRRCRTKKGTLGRSCSASSRSSGGTRSKRRCYRKEIQDFGPAKRVRVRCPKKR